MPANTLKYVTNTLSVLGRQSSQVPVVIALLLAERDSLVRPGRVRASGRQLSGEAGGDLAKTCQECRILPLQKVRRIRRQRISESGS